ncbi:DUF4280 domain-containing protein [Clostridium beijerinckii]|uniref:DUF4280 domain-containing protein n=1 Tax=Clostridium beijerinckii TaxID=1520 RepID=UPI00055E1E2C|nr:DUF4280 domain-containing protein [Clostridium beijerinckii]
MISVADNIAYVVRGARMKCDKGTHTRKINLPVSHGTYANKNPMMNKGDMVVDKNISYFGVCNGDCPSNGADIALVTETGGIVTGKKCQVKTLNDWINAKEDTLVEGKAALTEKSILVCAYGGQIKFVANGQK